MGFDSLIANPFIGTAALESLVKGARRSDAGIVALVYMSHPGAREGYGLRLEAKQDLYSVFMERALKAGADGVVIGAGHPQIIKDASASGMPVYSPGIGAQGGDAGNAAKSGADYLIVGRSIIESIDPRAAAKQMKERIRSALGD
jgi:orotidine-5'-phosphate decarboxylase